MEDKCARFCGLTDARSRGGRTNSERKGRNENCHDYYNLWFLWNERNTIREEGRRRLTESIVRASVAYAEENSAKPNTQQQGGSRGVKNWSRPPAGTLKLNCDAVFNLENKSGGWSFLIRDIDGDVVLSGWGRVNHLLNVVKAETIACLQGAQATISVGIGRLIIETDSMAIVNTMEKATPDHSVVGA